MSELIEAKAEQEPSVRVGVINLEHWGYDMSLDGSEASVTKTEREFLKVIKREEYSMEMFVSIIKEAIEFLDLPSLELKVDYERITYNQDKWKAVLTAPRSEEEVIAFLEANEPKKSVSITVITKIEFTVDLQKYTSDYSGQAELWEETFSKRGLGVGELDEEIEIFEDTAYTDYSYAHGENLIDSSDAYEKVDGRVLYASESDLNLFWSHEYEDSLKPALERFDPLETTSVVHRKGKDWFVGPRVTEEEASICWLEVDEEGEYIEEEVATLNVYEEDTECIERIVNLLTETRDYLNVAGKIVSAIEQTSQYSETFPAAIFKREEALGNIEICEVKEDILDIAYRIKDDSVARCIEHYLRSLMKEKKLLGKYRHLLLLEKLATNQGYSLVESEISGELHWAIKYREEEYHFTLAELFAEGYHQLFKTAETKIRKRLEQRAKYKNLIERAKFVFVSLQDSVASGNCDAGTQAFCRKHNINTEAIGGIRGDYLLSLELSDFTRRAVAQALTRKEKK